MGESGNEYQISASSLIKLRSRWTIDSRHWFHSAPSRIILLFSAPMLACPIIGWYCNRSQIIDCSKCKNACNSRMEPHKQNWWMTKNRSRVECCAALFFFYLRRFATTNLNVECGVYCLLLTIFSLVWVIITMRSPYFRALMKSDAIYGGILP